MVSWGEAKWGGDNSAVAEKLASGVVKVVEVSKYKFAALKEDGSVVEWGNNNEFDWIFIL